MLSSFNLQFPSYYRPVKARRVSRACDECRKRKTKCIGTEYHCQSCITKKVTCTYNFPSCKRGPKPKLRGLSNDSYRSPISTKLKYEPNDSQVFSDPQSNFSLTSSEPEVTASIEKGTAESKTDSILTKAYQDGDISWLIDHQFLMLKSFFKYLNFDKTITIDISYFILGLHYKNVTPSFKYLLCCILTYTAYHRLPHILPEYNDLYLSKDFYITRTKLVLQIANSNPELFGSLNIGLAQHLIKKLSDI